MSNNLKSIFAFLLLMPLSHVALSRPSTDALIQRAEFIFHGKVTAVEHQFSTEQDNGRGVPHTFVTFEINQVLKGNAVGSEIVLRFLGGPSSESEYMMISGMPLFDKGEENILFVTGNNFLPCPLVGCEDGRFRMIDGMVFTDFGEAIQSTDGEQMEIGETVYHDEVMHHRMSDSIAIKFRDSVLDDATTYDNAPGSIDLTQTQAGMALDTSTFSSNIESTIQQIYTLEELASLPAITSADPSTPFKKFRPDMNIRPEEPLEPVIDEELLEEQLAALKHSIKNTADNLNRLDLANVNPNNAPSHQAAPNEPRLASVQPASPQTEKLHYRRGLIIAGIIMLIFVGLRQLRRPNHREVEAN